MRDSMTRALRILLPLIVLGIIAAAVPSSVEATASVAPPRGIDPAAGIENIDHFVFIVQENRSFDHYFGTFPGANGILRFPNGRFKPCVPDPKGPCRRPYHDLNQFDQGGPHGERGSRISIDGGKMDGFVRSLRQIGNGCSKPENRDYYPCRKARNGPGGQPDVMGFHTAREIPNYWKYAKRYTLQDRMFAPSDSWTLPAHLFLVSGWSATCTDLDNWRSCHSDQKFPGGIWADGDAKMWTPPMGAPRPYIWAPITWMLDKAGVDWGYYVGPGTCIAPPCDELPGQVTAPVQNPLPGFSAVAKNHKLGNVRPNTEFFDAAADGTLPPVSWVMPTSGRGEHPPDYIGNGQAWVTKLVNAVMQGPEEQWLHTAIFITWDDWGGFYDHVKPIKIDENGYGIRVPGIMISPFAAKRIDSQTLSFDAYLKLVEDRFLDSRRLDGWNWGWRDNRPTTREDEVPGSLAKEFDFTQMPIPPLILDPTP
jgi:phospholipase C